MSKVYIAKQAMVKRGGLREPDVVARRAHGLCVHAFRNRRIAGL